MKFDLELETDVGCVSISLNKDFGPGEIEKIVTFAKSLVKTKTTREEALAWASYGADPNLPSVLAWGEEAGTYFELKFDQSLQKKINAIKAIRGVLGCGLKEAKDMVEGTMRIPPLSSFNAKIVLNALRAEGIKEFTLEPQG